MLPLPYIKIVVMDMDNVTRMSRIYMSYQLDLGVLQLLVRIPANVRIEYKTKLTEKLHEQT